MAPIEYGVNDVFDLQNKPDICQTICSRLQRWSVIEKIVESEQSGALMSTSCTKEEPIPLLTTLSRGILMIATGFSLPPGNRVLARPSHISTGRCILLQSSTAVKRIKSLISIFIIF